MSTHQQQNTSPQVSAPPPPIPPDYTSPTPLYPTPTAPPVDQPYYAYPTNFYPPPPSFYVPPPALIASQLENPVAVVPFVVTEAECENKYIQWVKDLWFAPTGFKKAAIPPTFRKQYVPFYLFSVTTKTNYDGLAGYIQQNTHTQREERSWHKAHGTHSQTYDNILLCADTDEDMRTMANRFDGWNMSSVAYDRPSVLRAAMHLVDESIPLELMWKDHGETLVRERETKACMDHFKKDTRCQEVIDFHVNINYVGHQQMIIYLPMYLGFYKYEGKDYKFMVNGQTGVHHGERPEYGLGKIGDLKKGVLNLVGTITKTNESEVLLIPGDKLTERDKTYVYNINSYYLIFPRSDSYLMTLSTGFVVLKNNGDYPIELQSQKRRGAHRGTKFTLEPQTTQGFDFKGHWCIEILRGSPADLHVEQVATSGGGKGNKLGMA